MKYKSIRYSKKFYLGNFTDEELAVEIELSSDDDPVESMSHAKKYVAMMSTRGQRELEAALSIIKNHNRHTAEDVAQAKKVIKEAQKLFPELIK